MIMVSSWYLSTELCIFSIYRPVKMTTLRDGGHEQNPRVLVVVYN